MLELVLSHVGACDPELAVNRPLRLVTAGEPKGNKNERTVEKLARYLKRQIQHF